MTDRRLACCVMVGGLIGTLAADSAPPSGNEILARVESESNRRHFLLKEYSGSRQYMMQNLRFGKEAAVAVLVNYRQVEGKHYTVLARSGSGKLNGIIDQVLASEAGAACRRRMRVIRSRLPTIGFACWELKSPRGAVAMSWS